jgi:hypothetical protein
MSWNGTVRCSHCYNTGHNKRKCSNLTQNILDHYTRHARHAEQARIDGDEYSDYARSAEMWRLKYVKRTKIDPATGEKVKNKTAKAERMKNVTCGYCANNGHTRRVCKAVKADYQVYLAETRGVREDALTKVREAGLGVGSMVAFETRGYNSNGEWGTHMTLNYIKEYRWNDLHAHNLGLPVLFVDHKKMHQMSNRHNQHAISFASLTEKMAATKDAPSPSLAGSIAPPEDWLDSGPDIKEAFPTKGSEYEKSRCHGYTYPSEARKQVIRNLGLEEHYGIDQ